MPSKLPDFGLLLPTQFPGTADITVRVDETLRLVATARDLGFGSVFVLNHFLSNLETLQPVSLLGRLIDLSGSMRIGTGVLILPLLHPVQVAEEFASLDRLAPGRIILGVGAGYRAEEFEAFGVALASRGVRLAEGIQLIRQLWAGQPVEFDGRHYQLHGASVGVRPSTPEGPPIWVGASGANAVRRAATLGDAWFAPGNAVRLDWYKERLSIHDEALAAAGRSKESREYPIFCELHIADTNAIALQQALRAIREEYDAYGSYEAMSWFNSRWQELVDNAFLIGDERRVEDMLCERIALGFTNFVFRVRWGSLPYVLAEETLRRLVQSVIPNVRDRLGLAATLSEG